MTPGQEIVFIGVRIDRDGLEAPLRDALLTDDELACGEQAWLRYPDPLPAWSVTHVHAP